MRMVLFSALVGAAALFALPGAATKAEAQPGMGASSMEAGARLCRRALPSARRFIGRPEGVVRARFRAPSGVIVRFCGGCTMDYRPNRLTFALTPQGRVRLATCG